MDLGQDISKSRRAHDRSKNNGTHPIALYQRATGMLLLFVSFALVVHPIAAQPASLSEDSNNRPSRNDSSGDLATKLSNPIANLISVPIKLDWDTGIGPTDSDRSTYVVQPVIPFSISDDWNLIIRTIIPFIDAESPVQGGQDESGLGDITQSFFFSPKATTGSGWILGVGPVLSYASASNDVIGSEKWGAGPTVVLLKQNSGWTYGLLANHIASFAGSDNRPDISATFLQPILSFTTKASTTYGINTESTYDWESSQWTVPVNVYVSQLVRIGRQPVSFAFGLRSYAEAPEHGPVYGFRLTVTLVYPK